jgi:hypothetical protein
MFENMINLEYSFASKKEGEKHYFLLNDIDLYNNLAERFFLLILAADGGLGLKSMTCFMPIRYFDASTLIKVNKQLKNLV